MTALKKAKIGGQEIEALEDQAQVKFLGSIFWFTVSALEIKRDDLEQKYRDAGVSMDLLPRETRDIDAFKNAVNDLDKALNDDKKTYGSLRMDKVRGEPRKRQLIKDEAVAINGGEYKPIISEWWYDEENKTDKIQARLIDNIYDDTYRVLTAKIKERYEYLKVIHTDKDIRDILRETLHKWYCISLRPSGGVYFVHEEHTGQLMALQRLLGSLGSELWAVKVRDVEHEKKLIYVKYEEEVKGQVEAMLEKITAVLQDQNKQIYPSEFAQFTEALKYYKESKVQYEDLLKMNMTVAATELDILQAQLVELAKRVKAKD